MAALAPLESTTEPTPSEPVSEPASPPAANAIVSGAEEVSLERMDDDGAPVPPPDHGVINLAPSTGTPAPAASMALPMSDVLSPLEQRVRRLEDAMAQLQEQHGIETRFLIRPEVPHPAERPPIPTPAAPAVLLDVGKRMLGAAAEAMTQAPAPPSAAPQPSVPSGPFWLFWDTLAEARAILRMFVDPRYHLRWSARVLPLVVLAAILTSYYWVPGTTIPLLGSWINKAVDLILAFVLFKWLGHEARRYRQMSPDLPPNLRL
jgi:hypothetical protein